MTKSLIITTIIAAFTSTVKAQTLFQDFGSNYNAIILGDLYVDSADTEGRQLVTGNFTTNLGFNYTVGHSVVGSENGPMAGRDDLVVGGNYINQNQSQGNEPARGVMVTENAVIGGSADPTILFDSLNTQSSGLGQLTTNAGALNISRNTGNVVSSGGYALSDLQAGFISESASIANLSDTASITSILDGNFALDITAVGTGTHVINISIADWQASQFLARNINANADSTLIINISGTSVNLGGTMNLLGGITENNVLINYYEATEFETSQFSHSGSILAPNTQTVTINGGGLDGTSVFGGEVTKTGSAEFHNYLFTGDIPPLNAVPEPSALLYSLFAFAPLLLRRNRHR